MQRSSCQERDEVEKALDGMNELRGQFKQLHDLMHVTTKCLLAAAVAVVLLLGVVLLRPSEIHSTGGQVTVLHMDGAAVIARAKTRGYYTTADLAILEDVTTDTIRLRCGEGFYPGAWKEGAQWRIPLEARVDP